MTQEELEAVEKQMHRAQGLASKNAISVRRDKKRNAFRAAEMEANAVRDKLQAQASAKAARPAAAAFAAKPRSGSGGGGKKMSGKPTCWVCRRAFKSLDQLQKHEAQSALHKRNLALQKKAGK